MIVKKSLWMSSFNLRLSKTLLKMNPFNIENDYIPKTNQSPDPFTQAYSDRYNLLVNKAI